MTPQEQLNDLMDKIEKDPQDNQNWLNLAGIFLSNKLWDPLISLFNQREMMLQDGAELMIDMLFSETVAIVPPLHSALLAYDKPELLSSNQLIMRYAVSSMQINSGQIHEGQAGFRAIAEALKEYPAFGEGLPHLNDLGNFANYFKSDTEIDQCQVAPLPTLIWEQARKTATSSRPPIITVSINKVDADECIRKIGNLFDTAYPKHFHVIGATHADLVHLQQILPDHSVSFSGEEEGDVKVSLFLRAGEILARHQRDIVLLDPTIERFFDLEKLLMRASESDVTMFQDVTIIPWLLNQDAFVYFKNTEFSMQYLFKLSALLGPHVTDNGPVVPSVMNCLNQYATKQIPDGKVQLLGRTSGFKLTDFFEVS